MGLISILHCFISFALAYFPQPKVLSDARTQRRGLQAWFPQEPDLEPRSLPRRLPRGRHDEPPREEARYQVVRRRRHGNHPRRRSALAACSLSFVDAAAMQGTNVQEDCEEVSPQEDEFLFPRENCFGRRQQQRDRQEAGEEEDQGSEEHDTRRPAAGRRGHLASGSHGLRCSSTRAGRCALARLQSDDTTTMRGPNLSGSLIFFNTN
jgi:hypothetical protein